MRVEENVPIPVSAGGLAKEIIEALATKPVGVSVVVDDIFGLEQLYIYAAVYRIKVKRKKEKNGEGYRIWRIA